MLYWQIVLIVNVLFFEVYFGQVFECFIFSGLMVFLLLLDNCCVLIWICLGKDVECLCGFDDVVFFGELQVVFGYCFGVFCQVGVWYCYFLYLVEVCEQVCLYLVVLGNVVYSLYFIVGQGFNLLLCDILVLVDVLFYDDVLLGEFVVLQCYFDGQCLDQQMIVGFFDWVIWLFFNDCVLFGVGCNFGLFGFDLLLLVKCWFVCQVMGFGVWLLQCYVGLVEGV